MTETTLDVDTGENAPEATPPEAVMIKAVGSAPMDAVMLKAFRDLGIEYRDLL